jgi:hypothetical protein
MLLARSRGELILKTLVQRQATFLLAAMEQTIMDLPLTYARRILGLTDVAQAHKVLKELTISMLNELKDLPSKVADSNWLAELEEKDEGK